MVDGLSGEIGPNVQLNAAEEHWPGKDPVTTLYLPMAEKSAAAIEWKQKAATLNLVQVSS